jgi:hypothetical protein
VRRRGGPCGVGVDQFVACLPHGCVLGVLQRMLTCIKAKESATINKKDNFDEIVSAATRLAALLKESSLFGSDHRMIIMTAGSILQRLRHSPLAQVRCPVK